MGGPTVVGYVDRLGYLYCLPCWLAVQMDQRPDAEGYPRPVRVDTAPHNVEPCDRCGRRLVDAARDRTGE